MRRRVPLILAACVLAVLGLSAASAPAATVTVFGHNGRTHVVNNPYLTGPAANPALPGPPATGPILAPPESPPQSPPESPLASPLQSPLASPLQSPLAIVPHARAPLARDARDGRAALRGKSKKKPKPKPVTFPQSLLSLRNKGMLDAASYQSDVRAWNQAIAEQKHVARWRATQLGDVTATLDELAADKQVTVARLPVLMLTLKNNANYWKTGPALGDGASVQFQGSELVWEYYAGSGIQLQVLHTFGEGDGYYEAGQADYGKLATLMNEMVPLAVRRAGGLAWEYYFNWDGGNPPWVSAMAQATGLEALSDAYLATGNRQYLTDAHEALPLLETAPPTGVAVKTALGTRYLQYSFTPNTDIINAFLQTLLGLYDYEQVSRDPVADALYTAGNRQAQAELRSFIVGGWSLYQAGDADSLSYHMLVTGFLKLLCQKTQGPAYCTTYQRFEADLLTRPQLTLETTSAIAGKKFGLNFKLSKYAAVGVTLNQGAKNYIYEKKSFYAGTRSLVAPKLKVGTYSLTMSVTDPVGHYAKLTTGLQVCKRTCPVQPYALKPTTGTPPTVTVPIPTPTKTGTTTTPTTTTPTSTSTTPTETSTTGGTGPGPP
jgi:D-glucuronyl C5-epimerase C-terminus